MEVMQSTLTTERGEFLATQLVDRREVRFALVAVLASLVVFIALAPFAQTRLAPVAAFAPICESALLICDLITAVLLFSQFNLLRSPLLLVLASGYLFAAAMTVSHALTFPGLFAPTGLLGAGPQSTAWLYLFWHGGFPLGVIAYALLKDKSPRAISIIGRTHRHAHVAILSSAAAVIATVCGLTILATVGQELLPTIMQGERITAQGHVVLSSVWGLSLIALVALWRRQPRTVLDLWLMLVMCAWLFDISLAALLAERRYDVGWYAGGIYGLLAASFLLVVLLIENGRHYGRLVHMSARQAATLDALPAHIALLDTRGVIVSVNEAWRRFACPDAVQGPGYEVGLNYLETCDLARGVGSSTARRVAEGIRSVSSGAEKNFSIEYPCHSPTEQHWFLTTVTPLADDRPNGVVVMHLDITERRQTQIALAQSEAGLQRAEFVAKLAHVVSGPDGSFEMWSESLPRLIGVEPAQLPRTARAWMKLLHPDDRVRFREKATEAGAKMLRVELEYRMRGIDGRWLQMRQTMEPLKGENEGAAASGSRWFSTLQDMTAEKQAEESLRASELRFRQMAANIRGVFFLVDVRSGRVLYISPAYETIWGRSCESLYAHPETWAAAFHPDDRASTDARYKAGLLAGEFEYESRIVRPDGSIRWVEVKGFPVRDDAGKLVRVAGVAEDITGRKRDQDALRELNAELDDRVRARTAELDVARNEAEQANRAKSDFLATMSHEIRTPMSGVISMIEVLHQTSLKGYQVEMVDLIRDSAFSLLKIIEDILDFSKIEAGKLSVDNQPMQLAETVEKVCGMLDHLAIKRGVRMTVFIDPAIPRTVSGDESRLRRVLVNLTSNAIKFSSGREQPGHVSVRVALVERSAQAVTVDMIVADNGIGIDDATLARLFTPFSQADISTTRRFGGTGLGLAISDMLVRLMGGEISVQSAPDQGSTFTARLRFARIDADDADGPDEAPSSAVAMRCRIVGRDQPLAGDLASTLAHAGVRVERSPSLAVAAAAVAGQSGLWLWLILPDEPAPALAELRALAPNRPDTETRFIALGWGKRRRPRNEAADLVKVDADTLFRRTLFRALALASGEALVEPSNGRPEPMRPEQLPPGQQALLHGRLILVAEDNETNRNVILRQLKLIGFAADAVVDGREALDRWRSGDFALLLTDLHMPHMDGYALTSAIRAEEPAGRRTPIIALTANALRDEELNCRAAGMDAYLSKPVRLEQLKTAIEAWLGPAAQATALRGLGSAPAGLAPPADLNVLAALIGDNPAVIDEVLRAFRRSTALSSEEMARAVEEGSMQAVAEGAHKLKAAARSIGALRLGDICAEIEHGAGSGGASDMTTLLPALQTELDAVHSFLDAR